MDDSGWCCLVEASVSSGYSFLIGVGCVVLTVFFSAATWSLRHVSWVKLGDAFEARNQPERTQVIRDSFSQLVVSTSIFRLLASLGVLVCVVYGFMVGDAAISGGFGIWRLIEAFGVSALVLLVFSLAIPYAWGRHAGTRLLVSCYGLLLFAKLVTRPLTWIFTIFDLLVRRLVGVSQSDTNGSLEDRQEELLNVVEEGEKEGIVDGEEREMIESVLEFRDTTVGAIMTPRTDVVGIEAGKSVAEAVDVVLGEGHSRFPVYEESIDNVVGLLYAKDLLVHVGQGKVAGDIRQHLRDPYFVPEGKTLRDLLHDFQDQKIHMAVVLDEYGGTAGVVTIEDILEELVGEIVDEYEQAPVESITRIDDRTLEVDARVHVDELNDDFDIDIPEDEDYETVGGFAFASLGYIPKSGEMFKHKNIQFTILDVERRRINRLRIVIVPVEPSGDNEDGSGNDTKAAE